MLKIVSRKELLMLKNINRLNSSGISTSDVERELEQVKDEAKNSSEKKWYSNT